MMRGLTVTRRFLISCIVFWSVFGSGAAWSATPACEESYTVQSGDTLSSIAEKVYQDSGKFNLIFYANRSKLEKPSLIKVGQSLQIPCLDSQAEGDQPEANQTETSTEAESDVASDSADTQSKKAEVTDKQETEGAAEPVIKKRGKGFQLLTASDYAPYTDKSLEHGGLITEIVQKALDNVSVDYEVNWIDDWSSHLDNLLNDRTYDAGFPWIKPQCPSESIRCEFLFSRPVFEVLILLFTHADRPMSFTKDDDILGKTLCRPAGYEIFSLEKDGREWVSKDKIKLVTPQTVNECFYALERGDVDGVVINDFTGREAMMRLGLKDTVAPLPNELSIASFHVLIHKSHPKATIFLNRLNKGLENLELSGEYEEIASRHLINHWSLLDKLQVEKAE